jgi:AcrR family transcriptional regulator
MLIYHFGSRDGLVGSIVETVEANQRQALTDLAATAEPGSPSDTIRRTWASLTSPELRPFIQLFYEAVVYASRHGGASFTTPWLASGAAAAAHLGLSDDPVGTRLGIAVMRGLLIDVITGDEPDDATAALERFISLLEARQTPV